MNETIKSILMFLSLLLFFILILVFLVGMINLMNIVSGTNAYLNGGVDYCYEMFVEKYNEEPLETKVNWLGDCVYKLHNLQKDYMVWYELK